MDRQIAAMKPKFHYVEDFDRFTVEIRLKITESGYRFAAPELARAVSQFNRAIGATVTPSLARDEAAS